MLPGLTNVLRRERERQKSGDSAEGNSSTAPPQQAHTYPASPPAQQKLRRNGSQNSMVSSHPYSYQNSTSNSPSTSSGTPPPGGAGARRAGTAAPLAMNQSTSPPTNSYGRAPMLPEEHRALEREKERTAKERIMTGTVGPAETGSPSQGHPLPTPPGQAQSPTQTLQQTSAPQDPASTSGRYSSSHMESSVTRLLVATKMLLESLTKWSIGQRTETQVSDVYVRLGNDFGVANVAFGSYGIDMSDLATVPDDLRDCLEACLSEDPSPPVLEVHLPRIREIIISLLQGLKQKQASYKQLMQQSRSSRSSRQLAGHVSRESKTGFSESDSQSQLAEGETQPMQRAGSAGQARISTQRRPDQMLSGSTSGKRPSQAPPLDENASPYARRTAGRSSETVQKQNGEFLQKSSAIAEESDASSSSSQHPAGPRKRRSTKSRLNEEVRPDMPASPPSVQRQLEGTNGATFARNDPVSTPDGLVRHSLIDPPSVPHHDVAAPTRSDKSLGGASGSARSSRKAQKNGSRDLEGAMEENGDAADPSLRALKSRDALERRASKRFSAYTFNKMGVGLNQGFGMSSFNLGQPGSATSSPMIDRKDGSLGHARMGSRRQVRASNDVASSPLLEESPPKKTEKTDYFSPGHRSQLSRGLSTADAIQEVRSPDQSVSDGRGSRADSTGDKHSPFTSPHDGQTTLAPPAVSMQQQAMSSTESLPFVDARASAASPVGEPVEVSHSRSKAASEASTVETVGNSLGVPPVPPLPSPSEQARLSAAQNKGQASRWLASTPPTTSPAAATPIKASSITQKASTTSSNSNVLSLFLQLGRQTRRAQLDLDHSQPLGGLSIAKLRMLFMDRFSYSPGKDDFPTIYVKDVSSGVAYELEDISDVVEGCVLTLNIEPLDQVKQHLDLSLGAISRELRDLKAAVNERERSDVVAKRASHHNYAGEAISSLEPTQSKISDAQFAMAGARVAQYKRQTVMPSKNGEEANGRSTSPTMSTTSSSPGFLSGNRFAGDLKLQYEGVQNVRRELAILRQIQGDFTSDVNGLLGGLKEQANKVRAIAATEVPTERNFIIAGKSRLDSSSQEVLTLVEDLLDTVDDLKLDVIQRGVKPKPATMKTLGEDIEKATKGLEELEKYIETVKPSWKKTWEAELQNIVDEQEFLNHQEGLVRDLREDHGALNEVFDNIKQVVKLRGVRPGGAGLSAGGGGGPRAGYLPPPPEEGHEGLSTVMMEVKTQAIDHDKRLRALQAAEKSRQKELDSKSDEFEDALKGFVDGKGLRKTGGHLEAERVRQRRDKLTIQAMFGGGGSGGAPVEGIFEPGKAPSKLTLGDKGTKQTSPTSPSVPVARSDESTMEGSEGEAT